MQTVMAKVHRQQLTDDPRRRSQRAVHGQRQDGGGGAVVVRGLGREGIEMMNRVAADATADRAGASLLAGLGRG